jgi:hypothetical protein
MEIEQHHVVGGSGYCLGCSTMKRFQNVRLAAGPCLFDNRAL